MRLLRGGCNLAVRAQGLCGSKRWQQLPALCSCNCGKTGTPESSPLPAVRCSKPVRRHQSQGRVSGFSDFAFAPEAPRLVAWSPNTLGGSSDALLAQAPLATLRESLFVSARASAWERAQRVPTRAVKDAQDSHGPRSLVRSSPAPRSTPGVYPGAPGQPLKGSLLDTQPLADATV